MKHDTCLQLLETALALDQALPPNALEHVQQCPPCGTALDQMLAAERALDGVADGLSHRVMRHMEDAVLAQLAAAPMPKPRVLPRWLRLSLVASPMLAAAALVMWVGGRHTPAPDADGYTARGLAPSVGASARVRVLCVASQPTTHVQADAQSDATDASLTCGLQDVLAFAVRTDPGTPYRYLFLLGINGSGQPRWYHPRPEDGVSIALPEEPTDSLQLTGVRLGINHAPGTTHIHALFTQSPLQVSRVEEALQAGNLDSALPPGSMVQTLELHLQ